MRFYKHFLFLAIYPECDAYVRVHEGTNIPVGTLANYKLRALRNEAHKLLDKIQRKGIMTKQECYQWIANIIMAPLSQDHALTRHLNWVSLVLRQFYIGTAFEQIEFIGAEPVDKEIYYPKFITRDTTARKTYQQEIKKGRTYRDDIFVMDILREEMKNDDPRIQRIISK